MAGLGLGQPGGGGGVGPTATVTRSWRAHEKKTAPEDKAKLADAIRRRVRDTDEEAKWKVGRCGWPGMCVLSVPPSYIQEDGLMNDRRDQTGTPSRRGSFDVMGGPDAEVRGEDVMGGPDPN